MPGPAPHTAPTTRRRNEALLHAIHEATRAELRDHGYHGVTFEGVARRAETSKPVLYRRFPSRAELVLAAIAASDPIPSSSPDTGELRESLLALFATHEERYHRVGAPVLRGLLAELPQERSIEVLDAGMVATLTALRTLTGTAAARGDLGPHPIPDTVLIVPLSVLRHEFLTVGRIPSRAKVEELLDLVYFPLLRLHSGAITSGADRSGIRHD